METAPKVFLGVAALLVFAGIYSEFGPKPPPRTASEIQQDLDLMRAANLQKEALEPKQRYEFERLARGLCGAEKIAMTLGPPDSTQKSGASEYWYYRGKTIDPITKKRDYSAQVILEDACVSHVNFN